MNLGVVAGALANGVVLTLEIAALAFVFALIVGLAVALCRLAPFAAGAGAAFVYVQMFRSISLYIYILWIFFGLPLAFGLRLTPLQAGVLALTLLDSAYMAESTSGDPGGRRGQWEASASLGMARPTQFFSIVLFKRCASPRPVWSTSWSTSSRFVDRGRHRRERPDVHHDSAGQHHQPAVRVVHDRIAYLRWRCLNQTGWRFCFWR